MPEVQNSQNRKYDLEERTAVFGENVIKLLSVIPKNEITKPLTIQLVKSATSVGANYCEADNAESKKDFKHKIGICKKEARESRHFLRMFLIACPPFQETILVNLKEATELNLIFNSIYSKIN